MSYFSYVGKLFSNVKGFYNEINAATLTGSIDTLIIEQKDGSYRSSPFHVRFGKLGVLRSREKVVDLEINGEPVALQMKLGESGEAFFVEEWEDDDEELPEDLATSPIHYDSDIMENGLKTLKEEVRASEGQGQPKIDLDLAASRLNEVKVEMEPKADDTKKSDNETNEAKGENKENDTGSVIADVEANRREHLDSVKSSHSRDADIDIRIENEEGEVISNKNRKKRRRKKKKNFKQETVNSTTNIATLEEADPNTEDIFEMEDLSSDEELSQLTSNMSMGAMSKSVSLPVVEENKFMRTSDWASAHEGFKYLNNHPFSDTDLSPLASPTSSRPPTPKSDTEVERQKSLENDRLMPEDDGDDTLWEWGNLPRKASENNTQKGLSRRASGVEKDKSSTGGLFHFMRKTKNVRHKPEEEGIYLDDLNLRDMDEETAKLYFPKRFSNSHFKSIEKDEDVESGRGASLPQSPHSVEGAIGGPTVTSLSTTILPSDIKSLGMYSISLCGGLADPEPMNLEKFMSKIVTYEDLCANPAMLTNPELVVKIEDQYYNWQTAAPIILSKIVFHKCLPEDKVKELVTQHMPKKKEKKGGYSWFSWRRTNPEVTRPSNASVNVTSESEMADTKHNTSQEAETQSGHSGENAPSCPSSVTESPKKMTDVNRLTAPVDHSSSEGDTEGSDRTVETGSKKQRRTMLGRKPKFYKRSLKLTSKQIKSLNLKPGQNEITYSVTTQYQGTKSCTSHIYLWKYNDKIIVSDIDGTITKSDVLGQILPVVGRDWSQSGVAQLYSRIASNGYKFLYLSARAIGQSKVTKDLLQNIKQGKMTLPEGPLLLSPTSLISAFHKEVIERKPEEFKISCLSDVASLFPDKPFYAGFGNKVNDVCAYKAVSIPLFRIFTINPYGQLKHELSFTFQSSYTKLSDVADHFFPPVHKVNNQRCSEYNYVQYWRDPVPEISPVEVDSVSAGGTSSDVDVVLSNVAESLKGCPPPSTSGATAPS